MRRDIALAFTLASPGDLDLNGSDAPVPPPLCFPVTFPRRSSVPNVASSFGVILLLVSLSALRKAVKELSVHLVLPRKSCRWTCVKSIVDQQHVGTWTGTAVRKRSGD